MCLNDTWTLLCHHKSVISYWFLSRVRELGFLYVLRFFVGGNHGKLFWFRTPCNCLHILSSWRHQGTFCSHEWSLSCEPNVPWQQHNTSSQFVIFLMVSFWLVSHSNHWQVCDTSVSQTDPHPHVMTPLSLPPFREGEDIGRGKGRQGRNDPPLSFQRRRFHPDNVGNSCSTLLVTYPKPVTHLRLFWLKNKEHVRLPVIESHTTKYTLCITVYLFYPQLQCSHCSARAIPFSTTNYSWY